MANIEYIDFQPMLEVVTGANIAWEVDPSARPVSKFPQIFWKSGEPWHEVNHFATTKFFSLNPAKLKTIVSLMKHLKEYASWLETEELDWRHFPIRLADRVIARYRKFLLEQRDQGIILPSTTSERMRAAIQFYRHAHAQQFVSQSSQLWSDRQVVIRYFNPIGFERTLLRLSSELAIPNRRRHGLLLEDGLTPLRERDMEALLRFTSAEQEIEMHLFLLVGFFTGSRFETISTFGVENIERAATDTRTDGLNRISVGPGTGVSTKFDVTGEIIFPTFLIEILMSYAYSTTRLRRQGKAKPENRGFLFLTPRGNPFQSASFTRLMTDLRRKALRHGLQFMARFKFHQTRCTFGTWMMELALTVAPEAAAIAFVRDSMLHKDEATTLRYIRFLQQEGAKEKISNEFSEAFSGIKDRDWSKYRE